MSGVKLNSESFNNKDSLGIDLNEYVGCNSFMGGCEYYNKYKTQAQFWYKKNNPGLLTAVNIEKDDNEYKEVKILSVKGELSTACYWASILNVISIMFLLLSWVLRVYYVNSYWRDSLYLTFLHEYSSYFFMVLVLIFSKITRSLQARDIDSCLLFFNRELGVVQFLDKQDKKVELAFDINKFTAVAKEIKDQLGVAKYEMYLVHKESELSFKLSDFEFVDCVLIWNYLLTFMDLNSALPDIPRHEISRHLDPVSNAYDNKINRKPCIWENMSLFDMEQLHEQARRKAQDWVIERKQLLSDKEGGGINLVDNFPGEALST